MTVVRSSRQETGPLINERIRSDRLQLIDAEGKNAGIVARDIAMRLAREAGLDLVVIAEQGKDGVPIAKIMDYGKAAYAKKKQLAEAKRKQAVIQVKELKMRPKIGEHDFHTKINQARTFLEDGKRVKFTLVFRGRENVMKQERGSEIFSQIQKELEVPFGSRLAYEGDSQSDMLWSRVYYLKNK